MYLLHLYSKRREVWNIGACIGGPIASRDDHAFGGLWTAQKLDVLRAYLEFFCLALRGKFRLVYIDTFAGTGKCTIKVGDQDPVTIDGSARIALDVKNPFDSYFFVEVRRKHVRLLQQLKDEHPLGTRVQIVRGDASEHLKGLLDAQAWKTTRGVLFLDPYGLQCSWTMVKDIAKTEALDVFFLVSLGGLTRQAAKRASSIDADKAAALDRFLGTKDWREALYREPPQRDMFNVVQVHERDRGSDAITQFVQKRMGEVFSYVEEPLILRQPKTNAPLFALFFAVSNRSPVAIELARKVGREILSKAR